MLAQSFALETFIHMYMKSFFKSDKVSLSRTRATEAHTAKAYPGFCSIKHLRVLLLPFGWDASPSQGYPQQYVACTHFIHLGGERQRGVKFLV